MPGYLCAICHEPITGPVNVVAVVPDGFPHLTIDLNVCAEDMRRLTGPPDLTGYSIGYTRPEETA